MPRKGEIDCGCDICGERLKTRFNTVFLLFLGICKNLSKVLLVGKKYANDSRLSCWCLCCQYYRNISVDLLVEAIDLISICGLIDS